MEYHSKTSTTALLTASLRALSCYEEDKCIAFKDYMATLFLPEDKREQLKDKEIQKIIKNNLPEGLYEYVIARTAYYDELIINYLKIGIPQIVLLGAGYDSRPYRYKELIKNTLFFELDSPNMLKKKKEVLKENLIDMNHIHYVPIDFEKDDMIEALTYQGYNRMLQTLFIWEGVTFYLKPDTVRNNLKRLQANTAYNSIVSFDYQSIDHIQGLIDTTLPEERIYFGIEKDTIYTYMTTLGYRIIEDVNSGEMERRYLTLSDGSILGRISSIMNIVTSETVVDLFVK